MTSSKEPFAAQAVNNNNTDFASGEQEAPPQHDATCQSGDHASILANPEVQSLVAEGKALWVRGKTDRIGLGRVLLKLQAQFAKHGTGCFLRIMTDEIGIKKQTGYDYMDEAERADAAALSESRSDGDLTPEEQAADTRAEQRDVEIREAVHDHGKKTKANLHSVTLKFFDVPNVEKQEMKALWLKFKEACGEKALGLLKDFLRAHSSHTDSEGVEVANG